jgi:hypothetical protein
VRQNKLKFKQFSQEKVKMPFVEKMITRHEEPYSTSFETYQNLTLPQLGANGLSKPKSTMNLGSLKNSRHMGPKGSFNNVLNYYQPKKGRREQQLGNI